MPQLEQSQATPSSSAAETMPTPTASVPTTNSVSGATPWLGGGECSELRLRAENDRLRSEVELLKQELAIKDARFAAIDPQRRPRYTPRQRLGILVLKSARGWNTAPSREAISCHHSNHP